ncbi:MAG: hypothetical protein LUH63_00965 [Parabacteroides sp.]|nr:hypothetical protein [Parabacteroides sp.]
MKRLIYCLSVCMLMACSGLKEQEQPYEPTEELKPAYTAITDVIEEKEQTGTNADYDLEETIRILNSLEVAQTQSESFDDFLLYMAKQDYSRVAPEVLKAKAKFFPVMQHMYELQKEHKEFSTLWMVARSVAAGQKTLRENVDMAGVGLAVAASSVTGGISGGMEAASQSLGAVNTATNAAFDHYAEEQKLKKELGKQIKEVKEQYVSYLAEFAPIYYKYMKEWDKLCLNKDKAYLDIYSGRSAEALNNVEAVLRQSPNNREGLLLMALCLIDMGKMNREQGVDFRMPFDVERMNQDTMPENLSIENPYFRQASVTLNTYMEKYPGKSAPALLLQGVLQMDMENAQAALSYFDQAAIEYPRQAEELTDLLNSYRSRTYLNKSVEGLYLLNLYKSTMEGFGLFSPNFYKAKYYTSKGNLNNSKEEILKHFYRRGNQGVYDCLLSDMKFCEDFLYSSFSPIVPEKSFIDVSIEAASKMLVMSKDDEIKVTLNNRSDHDLENVRVFLCIHYTDMYKDDYDVVKVPVTKNRIEKHEKVDLSSVKLDYNGKKVDDITRVRAIVMTDDKICWVDEVKEKDRKVIEHFAAEYSKSNVIDNAKKNYLSDLSVDVSALKRTIEECIRINGSATTLESASKALKSWTKSGIAAVTGMFTSDDKVKSTLENVWEETSGSDLKIELPRLLVFINPEFSINPIQDEEISVRPYESFLAGSYVKLKFKYTIEAGKTVPLYIYSDFVTFKLDLKNDNGKVKLVKVDVINDGTVG